MSRFAFALPIVSALALLCLAVSAQAADPMFTVDKVHVDASAASVSVAQGVAFGQGRPRAWQTLYRRLTRQQDWGKQPPLDDMQLQRIIRSFSVKNERRSTTRYVADLTYEFNQNAVQKILKDANIAYAQASAKRILLVPMTPAFSRGAFAQAFSAPRFANPVVPFTIPLGDALDKEALGNLNFDAASWMDVEPIAERYHTAEAVLVRAQPNSGKLTLTLKRMGPGEMPATSMVDVKYVQTLEATYPAAADATIAAVVELWKQKTAIDFSQSGKLIADVHISSLPQWASMQEQLTSVPNVAGVNVMAMDVDEARVQISYLGTTDQLHDALAQANLTLAQSGDNWMIKPGAPPPTPPPQPGQPGQPGSPKPQSQ